MNRPKCCKCSAPASVTIRDLDYCGEHGWQQTQADKKQRQRADA